MARVLYFLAVLLIAGFGGTAHAQVPTFTKAFSPDTIGPGATTQLVFTITNPNASVVTNMTFTDNLPAGVTIASAPNASTTCVTATVTAPGGGTAISLAGDGGPNGASVGASSSCTVSVNVTSSTVGAHVNLTGDLTSSEGNSGTATDTLTVATTLPGFSKAFSTPTTTFGSTVSLTFTIDNTAGAANLSFANFTDNLPSGMTVATPTGATTTCGEAGTTTTISAISGSSTVSFLSSGIDIAGFRVLPAGATCIVTVDVVAGVVGTMENVSGALSTSAGTSGTATDSLTVNPLSLTGVALTKQFLSSSVPPGSTIDVQFTLLNPDGAFAATAIGFTDDLDAALSGLVATGLPASNVCGAGSQISGTSTLTLTGGSLASRDSCIFSVTLQVPGGATDGTVTNTTSSTSATINGSGVTGDPATAQFNVDSAIPVLTKSFTNDPVAAGNTVTLEFSITNSSAASTITDLAFTDQISDILVVGPGDFTFTGTGTCGGTAVLAGDPDSGYFISYSGGSLTPSASCTFSVDIDIPAGSTPGSFVNTTSSITGTVGGSGVVGLTASDTLVVTAPALSVVMTKSFTDDPVLPGGTVTLEFNLTNNTEATALTDISFTDDLNAMLTGATASVLPADGFCGAGSTLTGTSLITMAGGSLAASGNCTFSVNVLVPGGATAASYPNTTSDVSGNAGGGVVTQAGTAATDTLVVSDELAVTAVKSFTDDPVLPGDTVTLEFTLTNPNAGDAASNIVFTDSLSGALTGLESTSGTVSNNCGTGSQITGTSLLIFTGGNIPAGDFCTFSVTLQVPAGATPGTYGNVTSTISSDVGASTGLTSAAANDNLVVRSPIENLLLTKSFTDDPTLAGDPVTLQFTLDNSAGIDALTAIGFTDDLGTMLSGATASAVEPGGFCGGATMTGLATSTLTISGASLAAGASCTFSATVTVPGGASPGTYTNTTSTVAVTSGAFSGTVGAATDQLAISPSNVTFIKSFTDDPVLPGRTVTLELSIFNPVAGSALSDIRFSDDLDAALSGLIATGLPQSDVCGAGSSLSGTSSIALTGGALAAGGSCTINITLQVPTSAPPGSHVNTTSTLTEGVVQIATAASDSLVINSPVPNLTFTKSFTNDPVIPGGSATAQFTITNPDTISTVTAIGFTDDLNAMLTGATGASLPGTGFCGAGSTLAGTSTLTMAGGSLLPGASCSFVASVQVPAGATPATYTNTTSVLAGTVNGVAGTAGTASDTLVVASTSAITFTKSFNNDPVLPGETVILDFTITNPAPSAALAAIGFTDDLNVTLSGLVATGLPQSNVCGAGSSLSGTSTISLSAGALAEGGSCNFSVTLQVPTNAPPGTHPNTTTALTESAVQIATAASDNLVINSPVPNLTFTKSFTDDPVVPNTSATLMFTITNPDTNSTVTAVGFTDDLDAMLTGATGGSLPSTGFCGAGSTITGTSTLVMTGGSLGPGANCNFTVSVQVPSGSASGNYTNTTSALAGTVNGVAGTAGTASDTLQVDAPALAVTLTKTFTDDPVLPGGTVTLDFNLTNTTEAAALTDISFTDDLDAMLTGATASVLPADGFCGAGSTLTGTSLITMAGGSLAASGTCSFSVSVLIPGGATAASYPNTTSDVSGDAGSGAVTAAGTAAADTLIVSDVLAVAATKFFTDDPVLPGDTVNLEFTLTNPNGADAASNIAFTDDLNGALSGLAAIGLPAGDVCGGGSTLSGTSTLMLAGGNIAAAGSCTFSVTLQVPAGAIPDTYNNATSQISSDVGAGTGLLSAAATDNLVIRSPIENLLPTKSFTDDPVVPGDTVTLQFTLDNSTGVDALTAIGFTDDLDAMLTGATATVLPADGFCGGGSTMTGASIVTISDASLAAGASCTFSATVQVPGGATPGTYTNTTSAVAVTSGGFSGTVGTATDQLIVSPSNVTFTKSFDNDPVLPGESVTLAFSIQNPAAGGALADIRFIDNLDAALSGLVATGLPMNDVCGAGSTLTGTSSIALTGGALAAGGSCNFSVTLQTPTSAPPGSHTNTTSVVTEGVVQIAAAASDDLVINSPVPNLTFTKSFTDDPVVPGGSATLMFTITNPDSISTVTDIGFTDDLDAMLSGATGASLPGTGFCGAGSTISGTSTLTMTGGSLIAGNSCSFSLNVQIPAGAAVGNYNNTTSVLAGMVNGVAGTAGTASDTLQVVAAPELAVTPATDFDTNGPVGGPFSPASQIYTLENTGAVALSFTAAGNQAFFDVSPASGMIAAGGTATLTASLNATADGLAVGGYSGTVTFTNLSNASATKTRAVNLTVEALGSITIVQTTQAGDGTFGFSSSASSLTFDLTTVSGTATSGAINLAADTYQVTQTAPDGYGLAAASCDDTDSTIDLSTRMATIVVASGEAVTCTFESVNARGRTVEVINRFLHRRADLILSSEPDGGRRIDRLRNPNGGSNGSGAPFSFGLTGTTTVAATFETSVSQIRAAYAAEDAGKVALLATSGAFANNGADLGSPQAKWDFWISGQVTKFDDDTGGGDGDGWFGIVYAGGDYRVNSSLLVGALVQIDYLDQQWNDLSASASGTGWMAGPYATVKITENLFLDTRAAWGMSSNEISPFNTYTDIFETQRWLVRAGLIGDWRFGDWMFRPSANVAYIQEAQEAYVDSLSVFIPGQTVSLGQFDFGPTVLLSLQDGRRTAAGAEGRDIDRHLELRPATPAGRRPPPVPLALISGPRQRSA